jgi:hypothetical protein
MRLGIINRGVVRRDQGCGLSNGEAEKSAGCGLNTSTRLHEGISHPWSEFAQKNDLIDVNFFSCLV